jgi:hypothetical protein
MPMLYYTRTDDCPLILYAAVFGFFVPYFDLDVIRLPTPPYGLLVVFFLQEACRTYQVQRSSYQMVFHSRTILRSSTSNHYNRMLLHIVACIPRQLVPQPPSWSYAIPSPGIYAVMTFPVLKRTLAIFLSPELGFLGFVVPTFKQTPFSSGLFFSCGDRSFRAPCDILPCRRTCINVHLCACDAGAGRSASAFWKTEAAIGICAGRRDGRGDGAKTEGRIRRRRSVTGIVGLVVVIRR